METIENLKITTDLITIPVGEADGTSSMGAYLARPAEPGYYPGVIVGFELFGLTDYIKRMTDRIAGLGYVAIAPDFYHRSEPGVALEANDEGRKHGFELLHRLTRQEALDDVAATLAYLRSEAKANHVGMVGFSVGGHIAYLAATQLDLNVTAAFYPGWLPTPDIPLSRPEPTISLTDGIARQNGYLLFLVGEQDNLILLEQRELIARTLTDNKVEHEFIVYPNALHGFFCDERASFNEEAAEDAWQRIQRLFAARLNG